MTKKNNNSAIYIRTATKKQSGHSTIKIQEKDCKKYAKSNGLKVVGIYKDIGVSGMTIERPALSRLLDFCKAENVQKVLMTDRTRLTRDVRAYSPLFNRFKNQGTELIFANEMKGVAYSRVSSHRQLKKR